MPLFDVQYAVGLLALFTLTVNADVVVNKYNASNPITYFIDKMAAFGPSVPDRGITGYIWNVQPQNACTEVAPPPDNTSLWIALIARSNCTFVQKVGNVQKWFAAAVIYNGYENEQVERMHGDGEGINIPSVFVGWSDGMMLSTNYCYNCTDPPVGGIKEDKGTYIITVDSKEIEDYTQYLLWPFAVVVGTCFVLMVVFILVKFCRDCRRKRKSRLSAKHLKKIPTKKFKKGDVYDCCAICLDDYEEGDKLRLLPCNHVYHTKCIDPWLTKNKRSCPICKRKVIPGNDPDDTDSDTSEDEGPGPSERTPLLGSGVASGNNNNRRSTFDNSGLPETVRQPQVSLVTEREDHASSADSDQSDAEIGAVGGAPHVVLAKENLMKSLRRGTNQNEDVGTSALSTNQGREETVVIETSHGVDNSGFVIGGEANESDDDEYHYPDEDVVFVDGGIKDEKKNNGVV